MNIAFFGHDATDAAVRRRITSMQAAGATVTGYTMRRRAVADLPWPNVDLGHTSDAAFVQRLRAMAAAAPLLRPHEAALRTADLWFARNLDMLAVAAAAHQRVRATAPLVYECLDIHRFMTRPDGLGAAMRWIEGRLLARCAAVLVSSPGFVRDYFEPRHGARARTIVVENRLAADAALPPRPTGESRRDPTTAPLAVGWFGNLRCARTLSLLEAAAGRMGAGLRVVLRGQPSLKDIPDFEARVAAAGFDWGGRYVHPQDLAGIYGSVDLVWTGDFHDARFNSRWLLPNRLYEGGYFGVAAVAPQDCETGRWLQARGLGFTVREPLEETLPAFLEGLSRDALAHARAATRASPADHFLAPQSEMTDLLARLVGMAPDRIGA